jgi:aminoglycoside 3-N-acetyltransferase
MAVRLRDLLLGLRDLRLEDRPVIAHASLSAFGQVEDGPETVVNALATVFKTMMMPTFTYKTMVTPRLGPPDNAMVYGSQEDLNRAAEFFTSKMPADPLMGIVPETLRRQARTRRSTHPILSFAGINVDWALETQTLAEPLAPIRALQERDGWALLLGVDHTVNTSIHYAERLAGRRTFIRWALTPKGVVECPGFPGCSAGFQALAPEVERYVRKVTIGAATVQAVPLTMLFKTVLTRIKKDPLALLCQQADCERCGQIRALVGGNKGIGVG